MYRLRRKYKVARVEQSRYLCIESPVKIAKPRVIIGIGEYGCVHKWVPILQAGCARAPDLNKATALCLRPKQTAFGRAYSTKIRHRSPKNAQCGYLQRWRGARGRRRRLVSVCRGLPPNTEIESPAGNTWPRGVNSAEAAALPSALAFLPSRLTTTYYITPTDNIHSFCLYFSSG